MKRKALITSTAILLVAIMCLATASYAWFTSGTTAKVAQVDLDIAAATGLVISKDNTNFTTNLTAADFYGDALPTMKPVSCDGVTPTFKLCGGYDAATQTWGGYATNAVAGTDYIAVPLYVKSLDSAQNVKIVVTLSGTGAEGARVAFVGDDNTMYIGATAAETYKGINNSADANDKVKLNVTGDAYVTANAADEAGFLTDVTTVTTATLSSQQVLALEAGASEQVMVYIWLEGQDVQTVNTLAGNRISVALSVEAIA